MSKNQKKEINLNITSKCLHISLRNILNLTKNNYNVTNSHLILKIKELKQKIERKLNVNIFTSSASLPIER